MPTPGASKPVPHRRPSGILTDPDTFRWWRQRQAMDEHGEEGDFENPAIAQKHPMQEFTAFPGGNIDLIVQPVGTNLGEWPSLRRWVLPDVVPEEVDQRRELSIVFD
jgi:hypothetical protein